MMINLTNFEKAKLDDLFYDLQTMPVFIERIKLLVGEVYYGDGVEEVNERLDFIHFSLESLLNYFNLVQPLVNKYYWVESDLEKALAKLSNVADLLEEESESLKGESV